MRTVLLIAFLSAALAAPAQGPAAARAATPLERALRERPSDPVLWYFLARSRARAGQAAESTEALAKAAELGEGFVPTRDAFAPIWDDAAFQRTLARLEAKLPRLDHAPVAFELDDRTLVPEGIAYDAPSRSFFIGSIAQGKVLRVAESGAVSEFVAGSDLDAILGLAVDAPRRILYAVSTSALGGASRGAPRNTVFAFDVDSRRLLQRHDVPASQLNDVTIARGGRVFASDSASGAIYEIAVKGPGPARQLVAPGEIPGSNGLAASPDARRLYVAHATGLAVVDLATGRWQRVRNDTRDNFAAIDGLYEWQGQLIGVQNVTTPGRVVALTLSADGTAVTRVQTLLSHHHNRLDEPTTGAVTDRGFFLLAATGVSRYRDGKITDPGSMPFPTVLRVPLPR